MILFYRQGNESQRDFKNTLQTQSVSSRSLVLTQLVDGNLSRDKARIKSGQDKFRHKRHLEMTIFTAMTLFFQ